MIPDQQVSYSDHEAVSAKFLIQSKSKSSESIGSCSLKIAEANASGYAAALSEGIEVLDQILKRLRSDRNVYFVSDFEIMGKNSIDPYIRFNFNPTIFSLLHFR